jgi:hypothetical protein
MELTGVTRWCYSFAVGARYFSGAVKRGNSQLPRERRPELSTELVAHRPFTLTKAPCEEPSYQSGTLLHS